jgi:photosystem II stability/assembly factor-like uncharacterized protein
LEELARQRRSSCITLSDTLKKTLLAIALTACGRPSADPPIAKPPAATPVVVASSPAAPPVVAPAAPDAGAPMEIGRIIAADATHIWMVYGGRALRSTDGGATFADRTPFARASDRDVDDILVLSRDHVAVLEAAPSESEVKTMRLFVSRDGGEKFTERSVPRVPYGRDSHLGRGPKDDILVLRSDGGGMNSHADSVLASSDDGATFRTLGTKTGYGAITMQSPTTWWTVGSCCASPSSVYRSTNAGKTWQLVLSGTDEARPRTQPPDSDVVFLDANRGWFARRDAAGFSVLAVTRDGGRTFRDVAPPAQCNGAALVDESSAILLGVQDRVPYVTRDLGATWSKLPAVDEAVVGIAPIGNDFVAIGSHHQLQRLRPGEPAWRAFSVVIPKS